MLDGRHHSAHCHQSVLVQNIGICGLHLANLELKAHPEPFLAPHWFRMLVCIRGANATAINMTKAYASLICMTTI